MIDQEEHINLPPLELLLDYLDGIVDPESRRKIEEQMEASDQLTSTIEGIDITIRLMDMIGRRLSNIWRHYKCHLIMKLKIPLRPQDFFIWRIAAGIALLISTSAVFYFSQLPTADEMVSKELSVLYLAPDTFRGEGRALEEFWSRASASYAAKQYRAAIGGLIKIDRMDGESPDSWFYLGLCHLYSALAKTVEASKYFVKVTETHHRLADRARWFLALTYYLEGKIDPAKKLLKSIEDNGGYKSVEADQLLSKLD